MKLHIFIPLIMLLFIAMNVRNIQNTDLIDWDEGVFAAQAKWFVSAGADGKPFNFQTPPLYQAIVAVLFSLFGAHDIILVIISLFFSSLTIYVLYLFSRDLFSPEVALYSVFIFVLSEFFLFFSKSGLSDATFLFFFVTALYFFYRGIVHGRTLHYLLAAIFTVLALYTKYSGPTLLCIMLVIAVTRKKINDRRLFLLTILLPILAFLPYVLIYLKVVTLAGFTQRHGPLFGIYHKYYALYLLTYAPAGLLLAVISAFMKIKSWHFVYIPIIGFFLIIGFYHPFFRLAYPLVPFIAMAAADVIYRSAKFKPFVLGGVFAVSILLGYPTMKYRSDIPSAIGRFVNNLCDMENIKVVYAVTPPNVSFYFKGTVCLPENHPSQVLAKKIPGLLRRRMVISRDTVLLDSADRIMIVYSTVLDPFKIENPSLFVHARTIDSVEFIDAPVYYKDIANTLRDKKQLYMFYLIDPPLDGQQLEDIWESGFKPEVQVIFRNK